jgi:diaminopropionate ammonia-lyase
LQVGVGSFAGAIAAFLHNKYPGNPPKIITFEPYNAACIYESGKKGDL